MVIYIKMIKYAECIINHDMMFCPYQEKKGEKWLNSSLFQPYTSKVTHKYPL